MSKNRVIKFRAWNGKKMEHFDLISLYWRGEDTGEYDFPKENIPLMQFTGLTDKNGKEIYEGDLIECYAKDGEPVYTYPHRVELPTFYREIWSNKLTTNGMRLPADPGERCCDIEVVGNVYENPELIEKKV